MIFIPCYHPLLAIDYGLNDEGKHVLDFIRRPNPRLLEILDMHKKFPVYSNLLDRYIDVSRDQIMQLPCGQCIGCKLSKSREWAIRCLMEFKYHESAYFITLTYDNEHLPLVNEVGWPDPATGELLPFSTVSVRDFQLFMKRLRKKSESKLRFFGCGEYGSQTMRAHYHIIVFGLQLDDLVFEQMNSAKVSGVFSKLYSSKFVESCWTDKHGNLKGRVRIGDVTFESCAYVARYTTKKKDKEFLKELGAHPEFILMSRKPGIARQYFEDHKGEIYDFDEIFLSAGGKAFEAKPPRYFDKIFDIDNHDDLEAIKSARRSVADGVQKAKLARTSLTRGEYLEMAERKKEASVEKLRRSLE